ncbi:hypothetical protein [Bifidobacterium leontopitheci]|nr:hypothetical protein [Bifidobacterium leontopitheci]
MERQAKQFAGCLDGKGFETDVQSGADVYVVAGAQYAPKTAVMVRALDAAGNPVSSPNGVDGLESLDLYPSVSNSGTDQQGRAWVMFEDSSGLAGTPYASRQKDYQACESKYPDFVQPSVGADSTVEFPEKEVQASIDFARDCRAKGFDWLPDPPSGQPGIYIPGGLSDDQLRRFLQQCPTDDLPFASAFMSYPQSESAHYQTIINEVAAGKSSK